MKIFGEDGAIELTWYWWAVTIGCVFFAVIGYDYWLPAGWTGFNLLIIGVHYWLGKRAEKESKK